MAWRKGVAAAANGETETALLWLERAARLAPDDPRIALDLANTRLGLGGAKQIAAAAAAFEVLTSRYDVAAGWLGRMAAARFAGEHEKAGKALTELLARHCVPEDRGFPEVASAVARAAGRPGYCGIDAAGRLHIVAGGAAPVCYLDGVKISLGHLDAAPDGKLNIWVNGSELLGSPIDAAVMRRVEGMVEVAGDRLTGWASRPAAPMTAPEIFLIDATGKRRAISMGAMLPADDAAPLTARLGLECSAMLEGLMPPFRVVGPNGQDILGSPIDPRAEMTVASARRRDSCGLPARARLAVVVPVYRGLALTKACLTALLAAMPAGAKLILVEDATPEPELADWLSSFAGDAGATLIHHVRNRGFPASVNEGLRAALGCDVLLLNSDTLMPPGAIEKLLDAVYARPEIGSATPFSNQAAILSYPHREGGNPAPDLQETIRLDRLAESANGSGVVEIPTGIGFCLLMRHDCIAATGHLRADLFVQGYGEENDWCQRAKNFGFLHVAATGAYVAHHGGVSFGAAASALNMRNGRLLARLYPGYLEMIRQFLKQNALAAARRKFDLARFAAGREDAAKLLISHNLGGGVRRRVAVEMRQIQARGQRPILLYPAAPHGKSRYPWPALLTDGAPGEYPNLSFTMPRDAGALLDLLRAEHVGQAVLHHGVGHHAMMRELAASLLCPLDIVVHDYASFCPRVHLVGAANHYCGEPNLSACSTCVAQTRDETKERLGTENLLARSALEFFSARRITAPSADAAARIARHFPGVQPEVTPWEDDRRPVKLTPPRNRHRRIAVIGGIGIAKGSKILLECAQDANARNLPLEFLIAGSSSEDKKLLWSKPINYC